MKRRAALGAAALSLVAAACSGAAHRTGSPGVTRPARGATTTAPTQLLATQEPWRLATGVSRPVVVADLAGDGGFVILGGLAPGDTSTSSIVAVHPGAGTAAVVAHLAGAVHDSAGADLGGRTFVFAGGSYSTVSQVQGWSGGATATVVGHLPAARSDLAAVTVGATAYIVGGFDGTTMDADVLATTDGVDFRSVARLTVPVRYPAVAAVGNDLWVMGGVTSTSESGTAETDVIQHVDLTSGQVSVVGHLPEPMGHATAVTLDGQVWILGGRSGAVPHSSVLLLDPAAGTARPAGTLPYAVSDAGSVVIGDVAYLVGGETAGPAEPLDTVVELRPAT